MVMGKTEPTEKLPQPLYTFKRRKVIMRECPFINVLSAAMLKC